MKFFHNYNKSLKKLFLSKPWYPQIAGVVVFLLFFGWGLTGHAYSPGHIYRDVKKASKTAGEKAVEGAKNIAKNVGGTATNSATTNSAAVADLGFSHSQIVTTIFWVGEPAGPDNGYIANDASTWDEQWQTHYGGYDNPNQRSGYRPAAFTPNENPFYFALPYSDISSSGDRKGSADSCPLKSQPYSWCKNAWLAIRHGDKIAYAQWQDVGPYKEDDFNYVFGGGAPTNTKGVKAGLDVSPAVRDYLGLQDVDRCDWVFINSATVPDGPWKQIITSSPGDSI